MDEGDTNHDGTVLLTYGGPNYDIKNGRNYNIENWFDNFGRDDGRSVDWRGDVRWQPESAGMVRTTMFLGIAFTEALALIGFVVFILIKFA